jgi:hypothetical protein
MSYSRYFRTATPVAIGIVQNVVKISSGPALMCPVPSRIAPRRQPRTNSAAEEKNQRSCSRSVPCARWRRSTNEVAASAMLARVNVQPSTSMPGMSPPARRPTGFCTPSSGASRIGPGRNAAAVVWHSNAVTVRTTAHRQRRLSGRPSGNSRNSSGGAPKTAGKKTHDISQADSTPPGRTGSARRA